MGLPSGHSHLLEQPRHQEKISALVLGWQYAFCCSLHYMAYRRSKACVVQSYNPSTSTRCMAYPDGFFSRRFLFVFPHRKYSLVVSFLQTQRIIWYGADCQRIPTTTNRLNETYQEIYRLVDEQTVSSRSPIAPEQTVLDPPETLARQYLPDSLPEI